MMSPALIEPVAATGAKAIHSLLSSSPAGPAGTLTSTNFQNLLSSVQTHGVQGLVGLNTGDLQHVLASLSPQQKVALGQQLMGSQVTIENGAGQLVQGVASKLQIQNGIPVFDVAGQNYNLGNLASVLHTSVA